MTFHSWRTTFSIHFFWNWFFNSGIQRDSEVEKYIKRQETTWTKNRDVRCPLQNPASLPAEGRESLTSWADRAVKVCRKTDTNISTPELDRLASWLFLEGFRDAHLRQHLREMPYTGLSVTLDKAIDMTMEQAQDDSDKWSTTAIVRPTPNRPQDAGSCDDLGVTQHKDESVSSTDLFRMLEQLLKEQQQLRGNMHRLLRAQQNLTEQQQSAARKIVRCSKCKQFDHYSIGCAQAT